MGSASGQLSSGAQTLFSVGGVKAGYLGEAAELNHDLGRWISIAPMPTSRADLAAAFDAVAQKLYAVGGVGQTGLPLATVEVYDLATDKWSTAASLNVPRAGLGAAAVNGKIYAIGGRTGSTSSPAVNTVEVYDPSVNSWTVVQTSLPAMEWFGTAVSGNAIYLVGGTSTGKLTPLNSVELYVPPSIVYLYSKN